MKNQILVIALLVSNFFLAGWISTSEIIKGPDGNPHQVVTCGDVKHCYEKATEVCGGAYQIVNSSSQGSGDNQSTSSSTKLLVKCQK